jgi:hypothetical protein
LVWQSWMPSVRTAVKYVQIPLKNSIKNLDWTFLKDINNKVLLEPS